MFYYSGDNTTQNRNGVAIVINKDTERSVKGFIPITERIALLKLNATPCNINIITAYAPTSESTEEEIDKFYTELDKTLKENKKNREFGYVAKKSFYFKKFFRIKPLS